ncbi:MAG: bifunctional glutamate--cysteine ligase GshA/glutathione synthetase GshB [Bacilli bacterium]
MEYTGLKCLNKSVIQSFLNNASKEMILNNQYGMEREMLRVRDKQNSLLSHPEVFGLKTKNSYITTDFAENQLEVVTPIFETIQKTLDFNEALYDIVALELKPNELLWPLSMPCDLSNGVVFAKFPESSNYENYRKHLIKKYGENVQMISGIHFNFSFGEQFLSALYKELKCNETFNNFKNTVYLKIINNYRYYRYLTTIFLSASPVVHESFGNVDEVFAIRSSKFGYCNMEELGIRYTTIKDFIDSVKSAIEKEKIIDEREIYDSIRIKNGSKFVTENLEETGIKYIEVRNIDINPYVKGGANVEDLKFVELILVYCLLSELREEDIYEDVSNSNNIYAFEDVVIKDLDLLLKFNDENNLGLEKIIEKKREEFLNRNLLTTRLLNDLKSNSFLQFGEDKATEYLQSAYNNRYKFVGFSHMELSTQLLIKSAVKRGVKVEFLDEYDNFIKLSVDDKSEIVKQCTQTNKDGFANVLAMSNKVVTKNILASHGMKVPVGADFVSKNGAYNYAIYLGKDFVVKPKSTNFGLGISIFKGNVIKEDVKKAIDFAFEYDSNILIEEYISGKEYRFLVIDGKVSGILNRVPANVVGDGVSTIKELVEIKNRDSLRGRGYVSPLEKINIDESAKLFLHAQNLDEESVLEENTQVFLRENSNISTGGDSIDYTDEVHQVFKDIAIAATDAFDITFCGVDIIIDDITNPYSNYGIIEVNFNPAIHIHSYPFIGKEREIAYDVLCALDLVK